MLTMKHDHVHIELNSPYVCCVSVCEYYAHVDCQDFVVSDCKECATYVPHKDLVSSLISNYWMIDCSSSYSTIILKRI